MHTLFNVPPVNIFLRFLEVCHEFDFSAAGRMQDVVLNYLLRILTHDTAIEEIQGLEIEVNEVVNNS